MEHQPASQHQHANLDDLEPIFQRAVASDDWPALVCHCGGDGEDNAAAAEAGYTSLLLAADPNFCL